MGNADAALLEPPAADEGADDDARRIADIDRWCADQLTEADRRFVATFRPTVEIALGSGQTLLCCHGSPRSFDEAIAADTPADELDRMLGEDAAELVACGHTHLRLLRRHRSGEIVNPGSVGLAYAFLPTGGVRVPPWAEFAIVDALPHGPLSVAFRRVEYDQAATVRAMTERGMPHAAWWAASGDDAPGSRLTFACPARGPAPAASRTFGDMYRRACRPLRWPLPLRFPAWSTGLG
jgi:diadenosine tetraphosphatase ApaH/serine/threonine PP2A family protein phosphatase